ncbi:hypothetical protein D9M68_463570 [compost metagenome]
MASTCTLYVTGSALRVHIMTSVTPGCLATSSTLGVPRVRSTSASATAGLPTATRSTGCAVRISFCAPAIRRSCRAGAGSCAAPGTASCARAHQAAPASIAASVACISLRRTAAAGD